MPQSARRCLKGSGLHADDLCMAGISRGQLISLAQRRRRRLAEALIEAKGRMIEAEHTLFVALRLAGYQSGPARATTLKVRAWLKKMPSRRRPAQKLATVLPLFPRGKRAA